MIFLGDIMRKLFLFLFYIIIFGFFGNFVLLHGSQKKLKRVFFGENRRSFYINDESDSNEENIIQVPKSPNKNNIKGKFMAKLENRLNENNNKKMKKVNNNATMDVSQEDNDDSSEEEERRLDKLLEMPKEKVTFNDKPSVHKYYVQNTIEYKTFFTGRNVHVLAIVILFSVFCLYVSRNKNTDIPIKILTRTKYPKNTGSVW